MPLFTVKEDTFFKAFLYASAVVGISTAMILEYRAVDPFGTYKRAGDGESRPISLASMLQTTAVSTLSTFISLWLMYALFGLGQSFVLASNDAVVAGGAG